MGAKGAIVFAIFIVVPIDAYAVKTEGRPPSTNVEDRRSAKTPCKSFDYQGMTRANLKMVKFLETNFKSFLGRLDSDGAASCSEVTARNNKLQEVSYTLPTNVANTLKRLDYVIHCKSSFLPNPFEFHAKRNSKAARRKLEVISRDYKSLKKSTAQLMSQVCNKKP